MEKDTAAHITHAKVLLAADDNGRSVARSFAVVRALANSQKLPLADEPTGNLDVATIEAVFAESLSIMLDRHP